jgi:hypothetical protein
MSVSVALTLRKARRARQPSSGDAKVDQPPGLPWYGLYAARRACATNLVALTGDVNAAYQVLGNSLQGRNEG